MKLCNKPYWIAALAAIFLSSKVLAAVQLCAHDMSPTDRAAVAGVDGPADGHCCDTRLEPRAAACADRCADVTPARRGVAACCTGSTAFESVPANLWWLPYTSWTPAVPAPAPLYRAAPLRFAIVFKNFRS